MSAWTGTRVPAKTGVPLRMSGDDVMIGFAIAFTLLSRDASSQGIERRRSAACSGSEHAGGEDSVLMRPHLRHSVGLTLAVSCRGERRRASGQLDCLVRRTHGWTVTRPTIPAT